MITFFSSVAYAASESVQVAANVNAWNAIWSSGFVVQLTIMALIIMSVLSWAIMVQKRAQFRGVEAGNLPFEEKFWKASSLEQVFEHLGDHQNSNMASVFKLGYMELRKIAESGLASQPKGESAPILSGIDNLQRALRKAIDIEISRLESRLAFLATVGSVGPFVGLFGTVWGIMSAFQHIGSTGMASLAVVAPGISEALITTGIGLAAAIPASVAYNLFVTRIKKQELELNNFAADFLNLAKRNFFRGHH